MEPALILLYVMIAIMALSYVTLSHVTATHPRQSPFFGSRPVTIYALCIGWPITVFVYGVIQAAIFTVGVCKWLFTKQY